MLATLFNVVVGECAPERRQQLLFGRVAYGDPRHDVARSPGSTRQPLAGQAQADRPLLAQDFLDETLHVLRPVAVGCVEKERKVGHRPTILASVSGPPRGARGNDTSAPLAPRAMTREGRP